MNIATSPPTRSAAIDLATAQPIVLGPLHVDPPARRISAGTRGQKIEPRAMRVLVALGEVPGRVLSRDQLLEQCWDGQIVTDNAVTRVISILRHGFAELVGDAVKIETIAKVGFRLVCKGAVTAAPEIVTAEEITPLLAVLPFDNLSSDADMQFFSDGVTEEIVQRLARGAQLSLIGRTSSFQFRGARKSEAPHVLGCSHIVDGSVRRVGDRVRIAAQLMATKDNLLLWSDSFDRTLDNIFEVQDEIAEKIARVLNRTFSRSPVTGIDPGVHDLYLRARIQSFSPRGWRNSIALLEEVTRLAPGFAPAWGWLAHACELLQWSSAPEEARLLAATAQEALDKALAIDPHDRTALFVDNCLHGLFSGDFDRSETTIARMGSGGEEADLWMARAHLASRLGFFREAKDHARRFYELDPLNDEATVWLGACHLRAGETAEARAAFERRLAVSEDCDITNLVLACAFDRDWARIDALIVSRNFTRLPAAERDPITAFAAACRDPEQVSELRQAVETEIRQTGATDIRSLSFLAYFGLVDEVFAFADACAFRPVGDGHENKGIRAYLAWNFLAFWAQPLHRDPRFPALCARLGLAGFWASRGKWPDLADTVPDDLRAACMALA